MILQQFGNNFGLWSINFIIVTYEDRGKKQVRYRIRRGDGCRYRMIRVIVPYTSHKYNAKYDRGYANLFNENASYSIVDLLYKVFRSFFMIKND